MTYLHHLIILAAACGTLLSGYSSEVFAQDVGDPFADYDRRPVDDRPVQVVPRRLAEAPSKWWLGTTSVVSWTSSSNEIQEGGRKSNNTLFLRLTPTVTFDMGDRWQLGAGAGIMAQSLSRGDGSQGVETDFVLEVLGSYRLPVIGQLSLVPGLGIGGYVGGSNRKVTITLAGQEPRELDEGTRTFGALVSAQINAALALSARLELRAGVVLTGLLGAEQLPQGGGTLSVRTFNTGLQLGLQYGF